MKQLRCAVTAIAVRFLPDLSGGAPQGAALPEAGVED